MSLYDRIDELLPSWMLTSPRQHVGKLMAGLAALVDAFSEAIVQGRLMAMPGQDVNPGVPGLGGFDSCDALPYIGRDRSIRQGLSEMPWEYAARLRAWLDLWALAGTPYGLLEQVADILGPDPGIIRLVDGSGEWWTRNPDGSYVYQNITGTGWDWTPSTGALTQDTGVVHVWNWDGSTLPIAPGEGDMCRSWLIIYAPCNRPWMLTDDGTFQDRGKVDDYYNDPNDSGAGPSPDAGTIGLSAPRKWVDLIRTTVNEWRCQGAAVSHLIVSFDPTAFNPVTDSTPTSVPDGTWGWGTRYNASTHVREISRFPNAEYIPLAANLQE